MRNSTLYTLALLSTLAAPATLADESIEINDAPIAEPSFDSQTDTSTNYPKEKTQRGDKFKNRLLKNIFGVRDTLDHNGVDIGLILVNDFIDVAHGSIKNGTDYLANYDLYVQIDGEKAYNLPGNTVRLALKDNFGGNPNLKRVKSLDGIDGDEVAKTQQALRFYEAWMQQNFFENKVSVLGGILDVHSEFMVPNLSANFLRYSFQVNQEYVQTPAGGNGAAVAPYSTLGGRIKFSPIKSVYIQGAVFNGTTGDPKHPKKTAVKITKKGGALYMGEAGFLPGDGSDSANKIGVGVWRYSAKLNDLIDTRADGTPIKRYSQGVYAIMGYRFLDEASTGRKLGVFLRGGSGDGNTAIVKWHWNAGVVATGFVPSRKDGEIGIGVTQSHIAKKQIRANTAAGQKTSANEFAVEAYYKDDIYRGVTLQPFSQFIKNPGANPKYKCAAIIGLRTIVTL